MKKEENIKKAIIFDASTLISLAINGLFEEIRELKKIFRGKFIITTQVKKEIIDRPITIKRFELEGLRLKELVDEKILELPSSLGAKEEDILKKTNEFLNIANNTFSPQNHPNRYIHLIDLGEASSLALSQILDDKKIKNVVAVDERTTRMFGEKPENLEILLQKKLHTRIIFKKENFEYFRNFKFIRSSELIYIAYKKKIVKLKNGLVLDALLYAVKFKGCAISDEEIQEIKNLN